VTIALVVAIALLVVLAISIVLGIVMVIYLSSGASKSESSVLRLPPFIHSISSV
jgi:hypothetical protein